MGYFFRGQFYSETPSLHFPFPHTNPTPPLPPQKIYSILQTFYPRTWLKPFSKQAMCF